MDKVNLTKKEIDKLQPRAEVYTVQDDELDGFELKVYPNGRKVFYAYYRVNGQRRRPCIGEYGKITAVKAREEAKKSLAEATLGHDPSAAKQEARRTMLLEEFAKHYMKDAKMRTKERTREENQRRLRLHILPVLGKKRLNAITRGDIAQLHQRLGEKRKIQRDGIDDVIGGPLAANRVLSLIKAMFNKAIHDGYLSENPAVAIKPFPEKKHERFLNAEELQRLAEALAWASEIETLENSEWKRDRLGKRSKSIYRPSPGATDAIKLLLYTGARRDEILNLRWEDVDLETQCLRLPDSKTGAKTIHLNTPAIEVLHHLLTIRTKDCPWVIEGRIQGHRMVNLHSAWVRVRNRAGLGDVRLHDLRHTHASTGIMTGVGLPMLSKLLGHTTTRMTERYAHLAHDPVKAAAEQVGLALQEAMRGGAKIIAVTPTGQNQPEEERAMPSKG